MRKLIISLCIGTAFLLSCRNESRDMRTEIDEEIVFVENTEKMASQCVESVDYITLEANENSLFSQINKMIIKDGKMYIGDFSRARVVVFDLEGNFIFGINKRGRGPGEYLGVKSFTVDENYLYIMDDLAGKLKKYDNKTGKFIDEKDIPVVVWDVGVFDNGDFMFVTAPLDKRGFRSDQSLHRMFITDNDISIKKSLYPYKKGEIDPVGKQAYLFEDEQSIVYHTCGSDIVHIFSKKGFDEPGNVLVDFGNNKIPAKHREDIHTIDERGHNYIYSTPVTCEKYMAFEISVGEYYETYLYNRETKEFMGNPKKNIRHSLMYPYGSYQGKYYTAIEGLNHYKSLIENGFSEYSLEIEKYLVTEGTVILAYTMK